MKRALLAGLMLLLSSSVASAVPTTVTFAGRLSTNAGPVDGGVTVRFALYNAASGGTQVWPATAGTWETHNLTADQGLVYANLGSLTTLDETVFTGSTLYLEIQVGAETLSPRLSINSVPYAMRTDTADLLGGTIGPDDVVTSVTAGPGITATKTNNMLTVGVTTTGCSNGQVFKFNGTGFACSADTDTTYTAGTGVSISGNAIGLVTTGCAAGNAYKWNGSTFACAPDDDTSYTAGAGVSISSGMIGLVTTGCAAGNAYKWNGSTFACAADANSTYSAGTGLALSGSTFGLITTGCSAGNAYKWNGSNFACAADTDTTYTAGVGVSISGTSIGLITTGCASGSVYKWNGSNFACAADADTTYTAGAGVSITGTTIGLVTTGCSAGHAYKWNGSAFACATDADTTYAAGTGLSLSGTTFGLVTTGCSAGNAYKWNGSNFACAADANTTYNSSPPISMSGTTFGLNLCPAGQIYKMDMMGLSWLCQPDANTMYGATTGITINASNQIGVDSTIVARKDSAAGSQSFDGNTLHLDYANNRVGVGTTLPSQALEVNGNIKSLNIDAANVSATDYNYPSAKTGYYFVPGSVFSADAGDDETWDTSMSGGYGRITGSVVPLDITVGTDLNIPNGSTITNISCYTYDSHTADLTGTVYLYRRAHNSNGLSNFGNFAISTTGSPGYETKSSAAMSITVDNANYAYWIWASLSTGDLVGPYFYGCRVTYTYSTVRF